MTVRFTILIPTFDNGAVIHAAIVSVLRQSIKELELFVVLDGAPSSTREIVEGYAVQDSRVRPFMFPKGQRHGEASRDRVLQEARGEIVCYLADDDIWFSDHLETIGGLLEDADFAHTRHVEMIPNFHLRGFDGDLADAALRARMSNTRYNFFGPTVVGHRLDAYRRLPVGWSPAPPALWSDLYMWRKWLAAPDMRLRSSTAITALHLDRQSRTALPPSVGLQAPRFWLEVFADPAVRDALRRMCPANRELLAMADVIAASQDRSVPTPPRWPSDGSRSDFIAPPTARGIYHRIRSSLWSYLRT